METHQFFFNAIFFYTTTLIGMEDHCLSQMRFSRFFAKIGVCNDELHQLQFSIQAYTLYMILFSSVDVFN